MTKIRFLLGDGVQIVGMSATLPNLEHVAKWLDGTLFVTKKRPVTLTQFFKRNDVIYDSAGNEVRRIKQHYPEDTEHVVTLCQEVTAEGASVLVFCEKKVWCKSCCSMIAHCLAQSPLQADPALVSRRRMILEEIKVKNGCIHSVSFKANGGTLSALCDSVCSATTTRMGRSCRVRSARCWSTRFCTASPITTRG